MPKQSNNFYILKTVVPPGACRVRTVYNYPEAYRFREGLPCAANFPEDAALQMHPNFPDDIRLSDAIFNSSELLLVSERFRVFLESFPGALASNEVLPVRIINHRERAEKAAYSIVHQIERPACLDEKKSKGVRFSLDPKEFQFLEKMVLDESRVPQDRWLFRPAQFSDLPLVRAELADAIAKENFSGVEIKQIAGYEF